MLRVQGFLGKCNLSHYSNWTGLQINLNSSCLPLTQSVDQCNRSRTHNVPTVPQVSEDANRNSALNGNNKHTSLQVADNVNSSLSCDIVIDPTLLQGLGNNVIRYAIQNQCYLLIVSYSNQATNKYAINRFPTEGLEWGSHGKLFNKSHILCAININNPAVIWIAGLVSGIWFVDNNSSPAGTPEWEVFITHLVQPFMEDFDAHEEFTSKHKMSSYPVMDLQIKDAVLVKAVITRYKKKDRSPQKKDTSLGNSQKWVN
ncbi:hypothetical protein SERLADRAFT_405882 [Serpula lacrymans var. lacrymans S7.9]|uniref:Uncharacterized protein n=1 Tax=Serpula lacrymans var. lacrymans (strain S7.9) TaxID=578457 RepID=F8NJQ9_SERL9|nr:uncharacterized protein SERLADRAFT_405882 [Serpula lacrymans var. lacrymans S7.9]EGO28274.1 hypothetical protein SERLADRAFT_405882 [Serpula lacrymans var. lacrymans S7.9]